jgi:hypothetical protein
MLDCVLVLYDQRGVMRWATGTKPLQVQCDAITIIRTPTMADLGSSNPSGVDGLIAVINAAALEHFGAVDTKIFFAEVVRFI